MENGGVEKKLEEDMPRLKERSRGGGEDFQGRYGSRMRRIPPQCSFGFHESNKRRRSGVLGEGGTVWEMAATSLHNDVLLDSEKCHE